MLRAAFFDLGDTLLRARGDQNAILAAHRDRLIERFGRRDWYEALLAADLLSELLLDDPAEPLRQRTLVVLDRWLERRGVDRDGLDLDELRRTAEVPRKLNATLMPGAHQMLSVLRARPGLRIGVISNTLWTGDDDLRADLPLLGLADVVDVVVTSHSAGYRKPHRAIYERALALADVAPEEAFMVGDEPYADVVGAQRMGMRAVWLRHPPPRPHPVGAPHDLRVTADAEITALSELPAVVERWSR